MKIVSAYPPNYEEIAATFKIKGRAGIIFTYGDTIYNPSHVDVPPDLVAHESVHMNQQTLYGMTPEKWWEQYLTDSDFRYKQELEAYRAQYQFAKAHYGRTQRRAVLAHISKALAGPMYGNLISTRQAESAIVS